MDQPNPFSLSQERNTPGHYRPVPITIADVPAGETRFADYVVPDLTHGVDWSNVRVFTSELDTGDEIVAGKLLAGQIGVLAADAAQGATEVSVVAPSGVLMPTALGGVIDEGFFVSLGNEASTAEALNAGDSDELAEIEIKRIGQQQDVGGGNSLVQISLFTPIGEAAVAGTPVNLVVRVVTQPIVLVKGYPLDIGGTVLTAGNLPPNRRVRFGFKNNGVGTKTVRSIFEVLY